MSAIFNEYLIFRQQNGPDVELVVNGDEFYARYETTEGYTVVYDIDLGLYCYAEVQNGEFVSTATPISKRARSISAIPIAATFWSSSRRLRVEARYCTTVKADRTTTCVRLTTPLPPQRSPRSSAKRFRVTGRFVSATLKRQTRGG